MNTYGGGAAIRPRLKAYAALLEGIRGLGAAQRFVNIAGASISCRVGQPTSSSGSFCNVDLTRRARVVAADRVKKQARRENPAGLPHLVETIEEMLSSEMHRNTRVSAVKLR